MKQHGWAATTLALVFVAGGSWAQTPAAQPPPLAPAQTPSQQRLVPAQSEVVFVSRQMGVPVQGHFKTFDAQVAFNPAALSTSSVRFSVDTGSATLGVREADGELPKPGWFDVARFPKASFQSTAIKALGAGRYEIAGKLTIKGISQPVVVPVAMTHSGAVTLATGSFAIPRLAFKIGENEWADTSMVANEVQVRFKLTLAGINRV